MVHPFVTAPNFVSVTPSVGVLFPILRRGKVSTLWSSFFLSFMRLANCILYLGYPKFWANIHLSVSTYCCSTYRVADLFSSLGTFSRSSIGGPVIHPIADCEHPLLCLLGPGVVSQDTALSGSFQQNLASVCNGVSVWRLIMGWIPGYGSL